jgi:hypothetical protein
MELNFMPKNNNLLYKYTTSENINISIDKTGLEELTAQKNINNNTDPRSVGAFKLFEKYPMGNILLHKVPRAGATISLVLEAADSRHETVCIIVPTNMIASKTIINDIQKYSSHKLEIAQILEITTV